MATCRECETQNEMTLCEKCIHGENCCDRKCYDEGDERALTYCAYFLDKSDYVKRERGEWIEETFETLIPVEFDENDEPILHKHIRYKCSVCGRKERYKEPFCHCGADMRKEDNNA